MSKRILLVAFVALAAGFGAGVGFHTWRTRPALALLQRVPLATLSDKSTQCVIALRFLRDGQTDQAIAALESQLDGALIGLGPAYQSASVEDREATHATPALRLVREYRLVSPYQPDARIAGAVAATLSMTTD